MDKSEKKSWGRIGGKYIVSGAAFLLSEIVLGIFINSSLCQGTWVSILNKPIRNLYVIGFGLLLLYLLFTAFSYVTDKIEMTNRRRQEYENTIARYNDVIELYNSQERMSEGDRLFHMALGVDTFESSRIKLLSDAAEFHHHLYAGVLAGNLYSSGLFNGDTEIIKRDYEKAYHYYRVVEDYDYIGIALWQIGWLFEHDRVERHLDKNQRRKKAFAYYERAMEKGYVKGYNSIGKFYANGIVVEKDPHEAICYYRQATKLGDAYSALNEAYIHSQQPENYHLAIECFELAIKQNSALAYLKFGEFLMKNIGALSNEDYTIFNAFDLFVTATQLSNGTIAARAYYNIGNMLSDNIEIVRQRQDDIQNMFGNSQRDVVRAAYTEAKNVFEYCMRMSMPFSDSDQKIYEQVRLVVLNAPEPKERFCK